MNRGKRNKKNMQIRIALSVVLSLIIVICAGVVIVRLMRQQRAQDEYDKLKEAVADEPDKIKEPEVELEPEPEQPSKEKVEILYEGIPKVDFEELWEVNTDICGWISIPGTKVDYPVLRNKASTDPHDAYYLEYNIDGTYGRPGAIYMEPCNAGEFTDFNTVLYGHNMHDGTMFAGLHEFDKDEFFSAHEYVYVVTPETILVYRIFAKVNYDDRHIMIGYDFTKDTQREDFLASLKNNRDMTDRWREGVEVTSDSRILTLSTCIKGDYSRRLLVEAVLTDEYENE